jgi:hypothetical protein
VELVECRPILSEPGDETHSVNELIPVRKKPGDALITNNGELPRLGIRIYQFPTIGI